MNSLIPKLDVVKRSGDLQPFNAGKLLHTLKILSWDLDTKLIDYRLILKTIFTGLRPQVTTYELQNFSASCVASYAGRHPDYGKLAGRMLILNIHKLVPKSFSRWVHGNISTLGLHTDLLESVVRHGLEIDNALVHKRDFRLGYISAHSLKSSYLTRSPLTGTVAERPQFLHMRVAVALHRSDLPKVLETYDALSRGLYTHATPILHNGGTVKPNFASCFIVRPDSSSTAGLVQGAAELDALWRSGGGVGLSFADVPAKRIGSSAAPGVMQLLRLYDSHAAVQSSSGTRRPCSGTVYISMWHSEVRSIATCRTTKVAPGYRAVHLFPGLLVPDLFMRRLEANSSWTLFDPVDVPGLNDVFGSEFDALYQEYEDSAVNKTKISASQLFRLVCDAQRESGCPFLIFRDSANSKNNQSHKGLIQASNLCAEILQYCAPGEPAVCTLASIALPRFVRGDLSFDFVLLHRVVKLAVRNLDLLLDRAQYPSESVRTAALTWRALGLGVQGFSDCLRSRAIAYGSVEARSFNIDVFETIYHAALDASCDAAEELGVYPAWEGSPASGGILSPDRWGVQLSNRHDFQSLRRRIEKYGLRNAMLTAQMPTASTAHLLGNSEGTEPRLSNLTTHRIQSGEYTEFCPWLVKDLVARGLWSDELRQSIVRDHGSVTSVPGLPDSVKDVYRTVWEIDPKDMIDMAADRGPFIDQSESLTLYVANPEWIVLKDLYLHGWRRGLKTGVYYLRSRPPTFPLPYGVPFDPSSGSAGYYERRPSAIASTPTNPRREPCAPGDSSLRPQFQTVPVQFGSSQLSLLVDCSGSTEGVESAAAMERVSRYLINQSSAISQESGVEDCTYGGAGDVAESGSASHVCDSCVG